MISKILNFFGKENQKKKLQEEMDELQHAINLYILDSNEDSFKSIISELVDVVILLKQLGYSEGYNKHQLMVMFNNEKRYKIRRTIDIIDQCKSVDDYDRIRDKQRRG